MCQRNSQLYQWKSYFYKYAWLVQIHLRTSQEAENPPASLDTVKAAEIREL